jgi:hypothetical protein
MVAVNASSMKVVAAAVIAVVAHIGLLAASLG